MKNYNEVFGSVGGRPSKPQNLITVMELYCYLLFLELVLRAQESLVVLWVF